MKIIILILFLLIFGKTQRLQQGASNNILNEEVPNISI